MTQSALRVFLGVPAVVPPQQRPWLTEWVSWFAERAVCLIQLERGGYGTDPWATLTQHVSQADGVVLLGFEQLDARAAMWRAGTHEAGLVERPWTTPWLQLEAGMAIALDRPLLVATDDDVREGVFDHRVWVGRVCGTRLSKPDHQRDEWLRRVRAGSSDRTSAGHQPRPSP